MTHMYFSARAEGRISYGHLGRTNLFNIFFVRCWRFCGLRSGYKFFWSCTSGYNCRAVSSSEWYGPHSKHADHNQRQLRWDKVDLKSFYSHTYDHLSAVLDHINWLSPAYECSAWSNRDCCDYIDTVYNEIVYTLCFIQHDPLLYFP